MVAVMPSMFAHVPRWCGREMIKAALTMITARPCKRQTQATVTAVFQVYCCCSISSSGRVGPLGKKTRKRSKLLASQQKSVHPSDLRRSHHTEAEPLHTDLRDSQESSSTFKCTNGLAAGHICTRSRQDKYVRERTCSGCSAEEDEVWRDAFGGAARNDSVMLREVGDKDSEQNQASRYQMCSLRSQSFYQLT